MSTILEALRKAKTEPMPNGIEARPGILSSQAHDYLAAVPSHGRDEIRVLRQVVYGSVAIIVLLILVVVSLLLRQPNPSAAPATQIAAPVSKANKPEAIAADFGKAAQREPRRDDPVPAASEEAATMVAITPLAAPTEAPVPQPEAVLIPISTSSDSTLAEETNEAVRSRAAQLRDQLAAQPDPKPRRSSGSSSESGGDWIQNLRIGGIVWDKTSPMATVEGKVIKPGSTVHGARVVRINKDSIVLDLKGREYTIGQ